MIIIKTSLGDIQIELDQAHAPETVANFLQYVRSHFYDDTIFHRVIAGFMIQGGGFKADMHSTQPLAPIKNEAKHAKTHARGAIAMARTNDPHSATSQFFINLADNAFLNYTGDHPQGYGYCVFGRVVQGMDVVDAIAQVKTGHRQGHGDVPLEDIVVYNMTEVV